MFKKILIFTLLTAVFSIVLTASTSLVTHFPLALTNLVLNSSIGFLLLGLLFLGRKFENNRLILFSSGSLVFILSVAQAGLWAYANSTPLMPILETAQALMGYLCFWLLFYIYLRTQTQLIPVTQPAPSRVLTVLAMLILTLQTVLGSWVSANAAGLVCHSFPLCEAKLLQHADYKNGLDLLNGIINNYLGQLSFDARVAVQWLHRLGGLLTFVILSLVMLSATSEQYAKPVRKAGLVLSALLLIQTSLGIAAIKLSLPLWAVLAHSVVAGLMMLPLLAILVYSRYGFAESEFIALEPVTEVTPISEIPAEKPAEVADSLYSRLKSQLKKTRTGFGSALASLVFGKTINADLLEEIEATLLQADLGIEATTAIIDNLTAGLDKEQLKDGAGLTAQLKQDLLAMLQPCEQPLQIPQQDKPFVILVVGVNGVGKTTTIGKLAKKLQNQGHSVMLAAGDTFRAAAVEQLQVWGERNQIPVVAQQTGADSASVIFDGLQSATAKKCQVLIADTAGRLHTKAHLMEELKKIKRIMGKLDATAPHEVLLVLDAATGQNALSQAKLFHETVQLTGLVLTKLDGTAKGGILFALAKQMKLPIRYIGVGETIDDLQTFQAAPFVDALFSKEDD